LGVAHIGVRHVHCINIEKIYKGDVIMGIKIEQVNGRYFVTIPFSLKDDLKASIPSAQFDGKTKQWHVGPRSGKKLQAWLDQHAQAITDENLAYAAKKERLSTMRELTGHTFEIKDELRVKFDAEFSAKSWYVPLEKYDEAQAFVDKYTVERKKQARYIAAITFGDSAFDVVDRIERAIKNFSNSGDEDNTWAWDYEHEDELRDVIQRIGRSGTPNTGVVRQQLIFISNAINKHLVFADETDSPPLVFDKDSYWCSLDLLHFFGLGFVNVFAYGDAGSGRANVTIHNIQTIRLFTSPLGKDDEATLNRIERANTLTSGICAKYNEDNEVVNYIWQTSFKIGALKRDRILNLLDDAKINQ